MRKLPKYKKWYTVLVQFENFTHCFEVCEVDVPAACRAVKKKIAESDEYTGDYRIEQCMIYR